MSPRIRQLEVQRFRNYADFVLSLDPELTVVVGANGIGKTNLVEGAQVATTGNSFRNPAWRDVVMWGEGEARIFVCADPSAGKTRETTVEVSVSETGRRRFTLNGKAQRSVAGVRGVLPSVLFTPDDLSIVKGPAENRRSSIDLLGEQLSAAYGELRAEYGRIIRQRNALLRNEASDSEVRPWTDLLVDVGSRFLAKREALATMLGPAIEAKYSAMSQGEALTVEYVSPWESGGADRANRDNTGARITAALEASVAAERARGMTLVGPHRDDVAFSIEGKDARAFGSQGQQRTIALALKLAEVDIVEDVVGRPPLLLLDDVMSELDESRRGALARLVVGRVQTLVTTTNLHYFEKDLLEAGRVVELVP